MKNKIIDHLVVLSDGSEICCPTKRWAEFVRAEHGGVIIKKSDYYSMPFAPDKYGESKPIPGIKWHFHMRSSDKQSINFVIDSGLDIESLKHQWILEEEKADSAIFYQHRNKKRYEIPFEFLIFLKPRDHAGWLIYDEFEDYQEAYECLQALSDNTGLSLGLYSTHSEYVWMQQLKYLKIVSPFETWKWKLINYNKKFRTGMQLRCQAIEPTNKYTKWADRYDF